jgi:hypothetical protein
MNISSTAAPAVHANPIVPKTVANVPSGDHPSTDKPTQTVALVRPAAPSALSEANETPAQTQLEASRGDQQAVRTLAKHAHHHKLMSPSPPGTGKLVKVTA